MLWRENSRIRPAIPAPMNVDMDVPVCGFVRGRDSTSCPRIAKFGLPLRLGDGLMRLVMAFAFASVANMQMTSGMFAGKVMKSEFPLLLAAAKMRIFSAQAARISFSMFSCGRLKPDARMIMFTFHSLRACLIAWLGDQFLSR